MCILWKTNVATEIKPFYVIYFIFNTTVHTEYKKNVSTEKLFYLQQLFFQSTDLVRAFPAGVVLIFSAFVGGKKGWEGTVIILSQAEASFSSYSQLSSS